MVKNAQYSIWGTNGIKICMQGQARKVKDNSPHCFIRKNIVMDSTLKTFLKLNIWLTAPKGATPVNYTSATNLQKVGIMWLAVHSVKN